MSCERFEFQYAVHNKIWDFFSGSIVTLKYFDKCNVLVIVRVEQTAWIYWKCDGG